MGCFLICPGERYCCTCAISEYSQQCRSTVSDQNRQKNIDLLDYRYLDIEYLSISTLFSSIFSILFSIFVLLPVRKIPLQNFGKPRNRHTNHKLSPCLVINLVSLHECHGKERKSRVHLSVEELFIAFFDENR